MQFVNAFSHLPALLLLYWKKVVNTLLNKMNRKKTRILSLFICTLLTMTSFVTLAAASPSKYPETLKVALGSEPTTGFDPILGWGKYGNPLFQSTLLKRDKDLNFVGDLATEWRLTNNKLTWIVTLRDDVLFSNGTPLTAEDVAFTFNQILAQGSTHDLSALEMAEPLTSTSVAFHLKRCDITFLDRLSSIGIVPKKYYQLRSDSAIKYGSLPMGSGPYILNKWEKGQYVSMSLNPYYYAKKPKFNNIIAVFGNEDSRFIQLKTHQLHLSVIPQRYANQSIGDYKLWSVPTLDNRGIVWPMNYHEGSDMTFVSSDPAIREAFECLIDKQLIVEKLLDGYATPAYSIADNMPWGLDTTSIIPTPINLAHIETLLKQAGWSDTNNNGIIDKQGYEASFTLLYKAGDSVREQLALAISSMADKIGIKVTVKGLEWNAIALQMTTTPVLMGFGSHSASEVNYVYHSDFAHTDFYNSGGYSNPQVDLAIDNALKADTWDESIPFWQQAQKQIQQDRPWTWLVNINHLYMADKCLDLAQPITEPHDHGWPLTENIEEWRWQCQ
ncbi:ABC transporter substrate-binding protein [Aliivibrio fischeri]|uniref:ABC transporter substrate-binding protein n=1 Tax=Aliivibrio fischeri TaxID=668 RepID=A0A6N3Z3Y2_ALIFS|nr:ABC transporter substrate-binding protein [Aliivibrio fischeri]MUK45290.1 ABC transporter substrate-binding protein [Aliivibrio fischeri]MUK79485.1 ABC transporter substrate-binding protein [Aliivibrio fischeri]MUK83551.1 ABC transporter substrate-binding protein [Aliivibrio fischeri]MUL17220.1 ABC transporter substrate-binding protein [Aliivibrio fischeri]